MNDKDFVHYQDLYNTDPAVQRLCNIIFALHSRWDDATEFLDISEDGCIDGNYSLSEYIRRMEQDLQLMESDLADAHDKIDSLEHQVKTRTVAELLTHADNEARAAKTKADLSFKESLKLTRQVEELTEKLNTWGALTREY
jgi:hypothetical protein